MTHSTRYDVIIIGGGFYGLSIATYLAERLDLQRILVLEKDADFMQRASYNNQARIHNGYHYPRSLLTGLRSRVNLPTFVQEYPDAVVKNFDKYYAIAKTFSKISARQFEIFSDRIGAEVSSAPQSVKQLFDRTYIEDIFKVKEYAFDAYKLKRLLLERIERLNIDILPNSCVSKVGGHGKELIVELENGRSFVAGRVFNCTYSLINTINNKSMLPVVPLKHELVEMCLVDLPESLKGISVTVMDGPFFSFMPFPDRGLTTLSHVRYTPHSEWHDSETAVRDGHSYLSSGIKRISHYAQMKSDVVRYIPSFKDAEYADSLWEIKTVLPKSEGDDSRPILYKNNYGLEGYTIIMGGKIDNIYDVYDELDIMYGKAI